MDRMRLGVRFEGLLGAACLAATAIAVCVGAGQRQVSGRRGRRRAAPQIKPGMTAPDFQLARLTLKDDGRGGKVGVLSEEKVRLSSFRGKRAVCIFSSSYT